MNETNDQLDILLGKAANGETLVALYNIIKKWVTEQLDASKGDVDEETVKSIVNSVLQESNFITEEDATTIINNAMSSANSLTEERVQEMIDESVGKVMTAAY